MHQLAAMYKTNNISRTTMPQLLMILITLFFSSQVLSEWKHENVLGTSECSECHEDEVNVWKKTVHQKNFKALSKNKDAKAIAKKMKIKKIKKVKAICSTCHYTVGNKKGKAKIIAGVSCESCHAPAKDWVDVHNDFGGKGINSKNESATHKTKRYAKLEALGMIRPDNTYGWARNCLNCHIVANEQLVNVGGHPAGSDFKLSKRTQGEIRHYPKADVSTLRYFNLVSHATELELSLAALSTAKGGKYATEMETRAKNALKNLKKANDSTPNDYAQKIINFAGSTSISKGNNQLASISKNISVNIMLMVKNKTGYPYESSKLKGVSTHKSSSKPKAKPASKAVAKPKTKPAPKSVAKPKPVPKPVTKPKATPKPVAKPAPKPVKKPKPARAHITKPKPVAKPEPSAPLGSLETIPESDTPPATNTKQLLKQFEVVVPNNAALCDTYSPWALGKKILTDNTSISNGGCFGVNVAASRLAQIYVFSETRSNQLVQLIPNNCGYLGFTFNALSANKTETIPKSGYKHSAISLNEAPGVNKLFVVVADNAYANSEMSRLASSTASICDIEQQSSKTTDTQGFTNMLEIIKKNAGNNMEWRTQKFQ